MKTIFRISLYAGALLAAFAMHSCTKEGARFDGLSDGITLNFQTSIDAGVQVKSEAPGEADFNENLLNSVYYFLYPKDVTDAAPAVSGFKTGLSETGEYSVKIPVSASTVIDDLFVSSHQCQLFAVANPPASLVSVLEGKPTLAALRSEVVLSSLTKVPQDNFTMVYDDLVDEVLLSGNKAIDADVPLKHLAVKFTIGALVAQSIEYKHNGVLYTYEPKAVSVSLCNGINRTTLSGWDKSIVQDDDYFSTEYAGLSLPTELFYIYQQVTDDDEIEALPSPIDETLTEVPSAPTSASPEAIKVDDKYYRLEHYLKATSTAPFYSYPMEWEFNTGTEPYLMYKVDWKADSGDEVPLYYKLTLGRKSITQNEWYDISAKLTIAGSLYPEEPTEIYYYMDYLVNGWKDALDDNGINTPAEIKDTRYLAVPQTEWALNNKNSVTIPFSSSHTCTYSNLTATKKNFSSGTPSSTPVSGVTVDLTVPNQVTVSHELNNTLGAGMDISPIEIIFTLKHGDSAPEAANFSQEIHITQYPAIYVNTELNSSGTTDTDTYKGYTYVNGRQDGGTWMTVLGANSGTTGSNTSRYFTVITVSQFDPSTGYIVGDPRDPERNNLGDTREQPWTGTGNYAPFPASAKYSGDGQTGNRTIEYYHPTIDDGSRDNFVAPSFRVSTAHTRSGRNDTYADIKKRCASYQEDGYPAGRWRIPTLAECKLIQVLSGNGMVPNIFIQNGSSYYYAAGWWFTISNAGVGNYNHSTNQAAAGRCVYDEWYWSQVDEKMGWDNSDKTTFTWGDVPDDFVIPSTPTP